MNLLVTTTLSCVIDTILPFLVRYISTFFFTKLRYSYTADDIKMRDELKNMKKEMSHISVHDEFAKYARLQRKFNQVNNTFNEKIRNKLNRKAAYETILIRILSALNETANNHSPRRCFVAIPELFQLAIRTRECHFFVIMDCNRSIGGVWIQRTLTF
ncbi:tail-anchored protein insertion receptor WRB-like isoform X2 [Pseudomyrmex gracilis]|uniref:tail-anchored protein insertion receptor WRB-like isoform X2 n=1 Tax=Pseudomyrmex gracilis TaxID=219809 RepID=UPI0009950715|nr:tail-anchored protein insertion receptor WRB-like isoform X2 [Pseudomyrmex gracilis]